MKMYHWDVDCIINERGKAPARETVAVNALNDERVARNMAVVQREGKPGFIGYVIARGAHRGEAIA